MSDKYNPHLESSGFENKNIQINSDSRSRDIQVAGENEVPKAEKSGNWIENQKQAYATSMFQSATEHVTQSWYEKFLCGLDFLKKYFNVTTADVRSRLLHSIVPFNPKFYDISETSPDLYGPFWIYTTLIFVIAAAGSLAKYINQTDTTNFFQTFVPISAGIVSIYYLHKIYGIGFGLPILLTILMKCFGSSTNFVSVLCTYGYSFTIFIPIVIACAAPIDIMQWVLLAYGVFSATSFILVNYWKEMSKYLEKRRYILLAIILVCQVGLFLVLKLYFFQQFTKEVFNIDLSNSTATNTTAVSTNTTSNNSNLLY